MRKPESPVQIDKKLIDQKPIDPNQPVPSVTKPHAAPSLVPLGVTIGLAIFSLILSLAGYVFRLITGEAWQTVLQHAALIVPAFVIGIPTLFWLGALVMNQLTESHIQRRNALSLGWLLSCVTMLWLMGAYS